MEQLQESTKAEQAAEVFSALYGDLYVQLDMEVHMLEKPTAFGSNGPFAVRCRDIDGKIGGIFCLTGVHATIRGWSIVHYGDCGMEASHTRFGTDLDSSIELHGGDVKFTVKTNYGNVFR